MPDDPQAPPPAAVDLDSIPYEDWGEWLPWPFNEIGGWLEGWWNRIWWELDWLWGALNNWFWNLWNAVHDWLRDQTWNRIVQLWDWIQGRLDWVRGNLEGWIRWVWDRVGDVWGWLQTVGWWIINSVLTPLWNNLQALWGWLGDRLGDLGRQTGDLLGGLGRSIGDLLGSLGSAIGNLWVWLGDRLGDLGGTIGAVLGRTGEIIGEMIRRDVEMNVRLDEAERQIEDSKAVVTTTIVQSGIAGLGFIQDFIQVRLINPLETYLAAIPGNIAAFFTTLLTNFWTTLQSWSAGAMTWFGTTAWPAIGDALGGLRDFVGGLLDTVLQPLRELLFPPADGGPRLVPGGSSYNVSWPLADPSDPLRRGYDLEQQIGKTLKTLVGGFVAFSVAGELMHPLKQLGFGRISALLWDMSNYSIITGGVIGAISGASLIQPLRYAVNAAYTPYILREGDLAKLYLRRWLTETAYHTLMSYQGYNTTMANAYLEAERALPGIPDLSMMYAKKEISEAQFDEWMSRYGITPEYLDVYHRYIWLDPRLTELVRIAQFYRPPETPDPQAVAWLDRAGIAPADWADWWFTYKIAKAGYERIDIPILVGVAKIAVARREQTLYFDAIRRLRRDGYISTERTIALVEEGWQPKPPVEFRRQATDLDVEYDTKDDVTGAVVSAYTAGVISEADATSWLAELGMDGSRVRLRIVRAKLGLVARPRLAPAAGTEEAMSFGD